MVASVFSNLAAKVALMDVVGVFLFPAGRTRVDLGSAEEDLPEE